MKWLLRNWLEVITAIGILYGIVMSTYNFVESRKAKKRRLAVHISMGWIPIGGDLGDDMIMLEVTNPGDRTVTINAPYIKLPGGKNMITPWPTASVKFPYELPEGKNCFLWVKRSEVKLNLVKQGYSGKVPCRGAVQDATGKKPYLSKKTLKLDLKNE